MRPNDNQLTTRVTERIPKDWSTTRGWPITSWREEIRKFGGREWALAAQGKSGWRSMGEAFNLQWT